MTSYEMRISDWSSDVCSSDRPGAPQPRLRPDEAGRLDDVDRHSQASGEAQDGAGVLGNVRLEQDEAHARLITAERRFANQIGRASRRENVCPYVWILEVAVSLKQKRTYNTRTVTRVKT